MAFDHTVAGVDRRLLIRLNIFCLRLRDFDLRFELRRIGNAREIVARLYTLTDLHRQRLQHASHSGFHVQPFDLVDLQFRKLVCLIDSRLLSSSPEVSEILPERVCPGRELAAPSDRASQCRSKHSSDRRSALPVSNATKRSSPKSSRPRFRL